MKISIITATYNSEVTLSSCMTSVLQQSYQNIEYLIIDGNSTDETLELVKQHQVQFPQIEFKILSEPDNGIYDALNKGIQLATGDVIAILHSGDLFYDRTVVSDMVNRMTDTGAEFCFSDLIIVDRAGENILRYYMAHYYKQ